MATRVDLYRYKCVQTEQYVEEWRTEEQGAPSGCVHGNGHQIYSSTMAIIETIANAYTTDTEGSLISRPKMAPLGWHYQHHGVEVVTSTISSVHNKKVDGSDYGFATAKFYNAQNQELLTQQDCDLYCVKTVLIWEPLHDFELVSGDIRSISTLNDDVYFWCVAAPLVPAQYGGNINFVTSVNLRSMNSVGNFNVDGRTPKMIKYDPVYHSGRFDSTFKHPAGYKAKFQLTIGLYKSPT